MQNRSNHEDAFFHIESAPVENNDREPFPDTEEFSPDLFSDSFPDKPSRSRKTPVVAIVLIAVGVLFLILFLVLAKLSSNPSPMFESAELVPVDIKPAESPALSSPDNTAGLPSPTPEATLDPYTALQNQADTSMMKNIVNIMLIGADYAQERETWSGKDGAKSAHADTMIVLAVNFENNTADLISLPRDTYAKIPGINGIYKLNASLDCGGGLNAANGAGFKKVCDAASRMIGGISIPYYYAVTMPAVKVLVDSIGGVDYDLDISFKIQGRSYKKGLQHMDGQAVLDYLRVRKSGSGLSSGQTGDANRVNRQKQILVAIFDKIKSDGLMTSIPQLLETMTETLKGNFFTNCTTGQTAALALYAYNMPSSNIKLHSMSGSMKNLYSWNFCFPKPATRRSIIREVYGVEASDLLDCTEEYAVWEYNATVAEHYLEICEDLKNYLQNSIDPDDFADDPDWPQINDDDPVIINPADNDDDSGFEDDDNDFEGDIPVIPQNYAAPASVALDALAVFSSLPYSAHLREESVPVIPASSGSIYSDCLDAYENLSSLLKESQSHADKYLDGEVSSMKDYGTRLSDACAELKNYAEAAASQYGYSHRLNWEIEKLADRNGVYVDFR